MARFCSLDSTTSTDLLRTTSSFMLFSSSASPSLPQLTHTNKRPRGLWKRRRVETTPTKLGLLSHDFDLDSLSTTSHDHEAGDNNTISTFDDDLDDGHSSDSSYKRRRLSGGGLSDSETRWHRGGHTHSASSASRSLTPDLSFSSSSCCSASASTSYHAHPSHLNHSTHLKSKSPTPFSPLSISKPLTPSVQIMYANQDMQASINSTTTVKLTSAGTLSKGKQPISPSMSDLEDWENLKALFARASEAYESDNTTEALPLLRAVIRECHRFMREHPDPSLVYAYHYSHSDSRETREEEDPMVPLPGAVLSGSEDRSLRGWTPEGSTTASLYSGSHSHSRSRHSHSHSPYPPPHLHPHHHHHHHHQQQQQRPTDPPTAFHAIFGTALFYMGTLIAQDPKWALPDEPNTGVTYWLAALDVFETGESLPAVVGGSGSGGGGGGGGMSGGSLNGLNGSESIVMGGSISGLSGGSGRRRGRDKEEDWRMAVVWGRTLVALAEERLRRDEGVSGSENGKRASQSPPPPSTRGEEGRGGVYRYANHYNYTPLSSSSSSFSLSRPRPPPSPFAITEPRWPPTSPFHAIASSRPPVTRRMSLMNATAHDVMVLAMDQFSRGIFRMPHPSYHCEHGVDIPGSGSSLWGGLPLPSPPSSSPTTANTFTSTTHSFQDSPTHTFSRPKELYTIATSLLSVAEHLSSPHSREYWATQADSIFCQMKMEADVSEWRGIVNMGRGRCWLVVGEARAEGMEVMLEKGEVEVLGSEEAEVAREGLAMAVTFFERAKGSATANPDFDEEDLSPLLAEALLTLANLTVDENTREELYARAQAEGGDCVQLEDIETDSGGGVGGADRLAGLDAKSQNRHYSNNALGLDQAMMVVDSTSRRDERMDES